MKVKLAVDAARWVESAIAAGTFLTPEDAVHFAVSEARAKLAPAAEGDSRHTRANVTIAAEAAAPKRTPQEAAARMPARRQFHPFSEDTTIRALRTFGRA